jgi:hypothetical protein
MLNQRDRSNLRTAESRISVLEIRFPLQVLFANINTNKSKFSARRYIYISFIIINTSYSNVMHKIVVYLSYSTEKFKISSLRMEYY